MAEKRSDLHRVGAIVPQDYAELVWYDTGKGILEPPVGVNCERPAYVLGEGAIPGRPHAAGGRCCAVALRTVAKLPHAEHGGIGSCTVCGSWFRHGAAWLHEPSGTVIHVGHECAAKYEFAAASKSRAEWLVYQKEMKRRRVDAAREMKLASARDRFIAANGLAEAWELKEAATKGGGILRDMFARLHRYGSLSPKQVEFALKLAGEIKNPPPPPPPELLVPAPEGRQTFRGKVVSVKTHDGYMYGTEVLKMTVKVTTPEGGTWLAWVTVPGHVEGSEGELKGATIELTATLSRGREPHFAFGKRPTGARIVGEPCAA